ncbi:MAG: lysophospholipid acyltransferase family protein [Gammaproteobacteria bacterium]
MGAIRLLILGLRSALFYLGYYLVTIVMALAFILCFPLLPDRGRYFFAVCWVNFILFWLRLSCGVHHEIEGIENLPPGPIIIMANHQSSWETLLFYKLTYPIAPILKKELLRIPLWGWAMKLQRPIAIDRADPRGAGKSLLTQGVRRIKEGCSIVVFPEGTRSPPGTVKRMSRGGAKLAVAAQAPIVPIAHNAGICWPPRSFIKLPGTVRVVIGEVISPAGRSASELTQSIETWIRDQVMLLGSN